MGKSSVMKLLDYLEICAKGIWNKELRNEIISIHKGDYCLIKPRKFGRRQQDKCIYLIQCSHEILGFFAVHRALLTSLMFADACKFTPVVDYRKGFMYAEKNKIFGTDNPFEYYFCQPCGVMLQDVRHCEKVVKYHPLHRNFVDLIFNSVCGEYTATEDFIKRSAQMQKKYIRLNDYTRRYLEKNIAAMLAGKKTLGVHVRGSDFKKKYNKHPVRIYASEYIKEAEKIMKEFGYEQIFLATDDIGAIKEFQSVYGNRVVYYKDVVRTNGTVSVMKSKEAREKHHYLLGLEVLRDAYTLAACDALLGGVSQVMICTRIIKESQEETFEKVSILDKGVYCNGNNYGM